MSHHSSRWFRRVRGGAPRCALIAVTLVAIAGTSAGALPLAQLPPSMQSVAATRVARINLLLARARKALALGHLVEPPGNNAAALYAEVLELDPGNAEARAALVALRGDIRKALVATGGKSMELRRLDAVAMTVRLPTRNGGGSKASPVEARPSPPVGVPPPVQAPPPVEAPRPPQPTTPPTTGGAAQPRAGAEFPPTHAKPPPAMPVPPPPPPQAAPADEASGAPVGNAIDRLIQRLSPANIAFNTPKKMRVNRSQSVQMVLSGAATADALRKQITAGGQVNTDQVRISDQLDVHLTGTAFKIEAVTPEAQAVGTMTTAHWEWQVTPTQGGEQSLHLTINAILPVDGKDRVISIRTYDRSIPVSVDWSAQVGGFLGDNWQWLWTAILVPIALYLWPRLRKRKAGKAAG